MTNPTPANPLDPGAAGRARAKQAQDRREASDAAVTGAAAKRLAAAIGGTAEQSKTTYGWRQVWRVLDKDGRHVATLEAYDHGASSAGWRGLNRTYPQGVEMRVEGVYGRDGTRKFPPRKDGGHNVEKMADFVQDALSLRAAQTARRADGEGAKAKWSAAADRVNMHIDANDCAVKAEMANSSDWSTAYGVRVVLPTLTEEQALAVVDALAKIIPRRA